MARAEAATDAAPSAVAPRGALLVRGLGFLALWIVLMGWVPEQLVFGVATVAAAAWASIRLLPSGTLRIRPWALLALVPRFLWQSVVAGVDVARRAFDPRLPLALGFVVYHPRVPPGVARNVFTSYTSLLPGTVPCGDDEGGVIYHCLDIGQPVLEQLSAEEARLTRAIAPGVAAAANAPSGAMDAADV
jgi:multicomponent Na+:H+ antiporter subunit E